VAMKITSSQYYILFGVLILGGIFLRVYRLNTTYPMSLSFSRGMHNDEGALASNARNKIIHGKWLVGENSYGTPYVLLPVYNILVYLTFSVIGVGLVQLRLLHVFTSILTCFLIHLILRHDNIDYEYVLFSIVLYLYSSFNALTNRIGFAGNPMMLFIAISVYFYILSEKKKEFAFFSGVFAVLSIFIKTYALVLLPVLFIDSFFRMLTEYKKYQHFVLLLLGIAVCVGVLGLHFYPKLSQVESCIKFEKDPSNTHTPSLKKIVNMNSKDRWHVIYNFLKIPVLSTVAFIFFITYIRSFFVENTGKEDNVRGRSLIAMLFLAFLVLFLSMPYKPPRRLIFLMFPMSVLGAYFMTLFSRVKFGVFFLFGLSSLIFPFFCLLFELFGSVYPFEVILKFLSANVGYEREAFYVGTFLFAAVLLLSLTFKNRLSKVLSLRGLVSFFIIFFLFFNLRSWYMVISASSPWVYNIGRELGEILPPSSVLVGREVSSLSLENKNIPYRTLPKNFAREQYREKILWTTNPSEIKPKPFKIYFLENGAYMAFWKTNPLSKKLKL